jgi:hypothetical protein
MTSVDDILSKLEAQRAEMAELAADEARLNALEVLHVQLIRTEIEGVKARLDEQQLMLATPTTAQRIAARSPSSEASSSEWSTSTQQITSPTMSASPTPRRTPKERRRSGSERGTPPPLLPPPLAKADQECVHCNDMFSDARAHMATCERRPLVCKDCGERFIGRDEATHDNQCAAREKKRAALAAKEAAAAARRADIEAAEAEAAPAHVVPADDATAPPPDITVEVDASTKLEARQALPPAIPQSATGQDGHYPSAVAFVHSVVSQPAAASTPVTPGVVLRHLSKRAPERHDNPCADDLDAWATEVSRRCGERRQTALATHVFHQSAALLGVAVEYRQSQWMAFQDGVADAFDHCFRRK